MPLFTHLTSVSLTHCVACDGQLRIFGTSGGRTAFALRRVRAMPPSLCASSYKRCPMYHHVKKLMYTVRVDEPDPAFGNMLLEQFGGANGELAAAMQYSIQGLNCEDPGRKDLLMDIGTEELSHLEIVGYLARMHLKPLKSVREAAEADPLIAIAGGGGVNLFNSMGNAWTADYLKITGELDVDLRSNIAAEARAKIVYERLINFCRDRRHQGCAAVSDDPRDHPYAGLHAGAREHGQAAVHASAGSPRRRSWSTSSSTIRPARATMARSTRAAPGTKASRGNSSNPGIPGLQRRRHRCAVDPCRKLRPSTIPSRCRSFSSISCATSCTPRSSCSKALPKMAKAARTGSAANTARDASRGDGGAGRAPEREPSKLLGAPARAKPCKGMAGLIEEGEEVMSEGKKKDDAPADLALIGAAQRVEHYEIAAYTTARNLALQLPATARSSQLLTLVARRGAERRPAARSGVRSH